MYMRAPVDGPITIEWIRQTSRGYSQYLTQCAHRTFAKVGGTPDWSFGLLSPRIVRSKGARIESTVQFCDVHGRGTPTVRNSIL